MRLALALTPISDHHLRLASQIGVTDLVSRYPGKEPDALLRLRDRAVSYGLRLSVVEGYIPHDQIVHGRLGRDDQIRNFQNLLREMARAEIPICCYNWMPSDDWTRTCMNISERGGALVTGFAAAADVGFKAAPNEAATAETLWANLRYFLHQVIPIAEESGVKG